MLAAVGAERQYRPSADRSAAASRRAAPRTAAAPAPAGPRSGTSMRARLVIINFYEFKLKQKQTNKQTKYLHTHTRPVKYSGHLGRLT